MCKPVEISNTADVVCNEDKEDVVVKPNVVGVRHAQGVLLFGALVVGYFLRVNMSAAVVAMIEPSPQAAHYDWGTSDRSLILSSFFWGYVVAQLPSSLIAKRYGAKIVLVVTTAIAAILTIGIPLAARVGGWQLVCAIRVIVGLGQGTVYPCVHTLLSQWAPKTERSVLSTFVYTGAQIGTVIILATSGVFTNSAVGWPSIFYFSGAVSFAWAVVYMIFGADAPCDSRVISTAEREYIERYTGASNNNKDMPVPWKSIFTSISFYAVLLGHCGYSWGFYTLLTEIPTYLSSALDMDMKKNALLSALPYFAMWLLSFVFSPICDMLINRQILSVANCRKLFNSIGQWGPMLCLIALGYMTKEQTMLAVLFLTLAVGLNSATYCGFLVNHMDLSPNFAGPMMGVTNGLANLLSIFAPLVVGAVVTDESDSTQWRIVFFLTAGVYLVCNSVFVLFGRATIEPWNEPSPAKTTENDSNTKECKEMSVL